jgi:septum formation protein
LLERLGLPFEVDPADVDESPLPGEAAEALALRLSETKAKTVARRHPDAVIIASDQLGVAAGRLLGKPGTQQNAVRQLQAAAGKEVLFLTGLCVLDAANGRCLSGVERFGVRFRPLLEAQIRDYVRREDPLDCAGSFKVEGLGIALFSALEGRDPTALEGLPLILLTDFLEEVGIRVLGG